MLEKDISKKLKEAMKAGKKVEVSVLRMVISEIKNKKIDEGLKELEDDKTLGVIQKIARQHKESISQFTEGNRSDLVAAEEEELAILKEYLPEQLSPEAVKKIVNEVISDTGVTSLKEIGQVMKEVMARVKGRADGKIINQVVKEQLGG